MNEDTFEYLQKEARYALKSKSLTKVYEAYGEAKMARKLLLITLDQFLKINEQLICNGVNNPKAGIR